MADLCCEYAIAGITINDDTVGADRLVLGDDGADGLDGAPIRGTVDNKGQTHGGLVFPKFYGPRVITFRGYVHIQSVPNAPTTAYYAAVNAVEAAVVSALQGILNSESALQWTPHGQTARSIQVTYGTAGGEVKFSGSMNERTFEFTLIADDPTIS